MVLFLGVRMHALQEKALDGLLVFADQEQVDFLDGLTELVERFRALAVPKAKRAPSAYHRFVREQTARLKAERPDLTAMARRTEVNRLWQLQKTDNNKPFLVSHNPLFVSDSETE